MYRQWMNVSETRKEKVETGEERGAILGAQQSINDTRPARVSPPHSTALLPRETHQMDPHTHTHKKRKTHKKANRGSFLFDFKIPGMKKEGAPWSWCPLPRLAPSPKEPPLVTATNPSYVVGTLARAAMGGPIQTQNQ